MRHLSACLALSLMACDLAGTLLYEDPPTPEFVSAETTCAEDSLSLVALIDSDVLTTNLVIEPTEEDGDPLDALFPLNDLSQADDRVTRWSDAIDHDCDDPLTFVWTAYTVQETQASTTTRYPETAPETDVLEPPYGSELGGDTITLSGEWLNEVLTVHFGDVEAEIVELDSELAVFLSPPGDIGTVDVVIEGENGTTTLTDAFTYYQDQTGLVRGIGNLGLSFYSEDLLGYDSAYGVVDGPFAQFEVLFHEPVEPEYTWWGQYPDPGTCESSDQLAFTSTWPSAYLGLEDLDGELGKFALVTVEDGGTYYMVAGDVAVEEWAGTTFDLSWGDDLDDLPAMSVPGGIDTAPMPTDLSLDWQVAETWVREQDLALTYLQDPFIEGALITWYVTTTGNSVLDADSCMHDASTGRIDLAWDDLFAGVDPAAAGRVYLMVEFWGDQLVELPHDRSLFWNRGVTTVWYRLELVDG